MTEPVFADTLAHHPFKPFPTEYTDRYTPEQARQDGARFERQNLINRIRKIDNPTKQVKQLLAELEKEEN